LIAGQNFIPFPIRFAMRPLLTITALVLSIVASPVSLSQDSHTIESEAKKAVDIRVQKGGWGTASEEQIEIVLQSVAQEMLQFFPERRLNSILVSHSNETPIVLYQKGPRNEYQVFLCAENTRWAQYAYEFGHEFCHILSNYDRHTQMGKEHRWFDETLCETASLYTLRSLARKWETNPPVAEWRGYAPRLREYSEHFLNEPHRMLPTNISLNAWFHQNEKDLRTSPYLRQRNEVVANMLLPIFEQDPQNWAAIGYLNLQPASGTFEDYLNHWHESVPEPQRAAVESTMSLFGMALNPAVRVTAGPNPLDAKAAHQGSAGASGADNPE
jgi:hypothetical protein